ncbi:DUF3810 domain-containing protein [Oscillospiraceae bacterium MB08-C2-2]|nr:DUF3810 domain-containing protein [Oscillospiraceae bacterium MB08-C2-2]
MAFLRKHWWLLCLTPAGLLLTYLASLGSGWVERFYAQGVYVAFARIVGGAFSLVPFSVAECIVVGGSCVLVGWLISTVRRAITQKEGRWEVLLTFLFKVLSIASVIYFIFVLFCGINYSRPSFREQSGLPVRPSSSQELAALCAELVEQANLYRPQCASYPDGTAALAQGTWETASLMPGAYEGVAQSYPILGGWAPRVKPVRWSQGMSYLNITGVFTPFTFEANVNTHVPSYTLPATMAHELAHYKGFMREEEANFIGYLACVQSGRPDFAYSGVMLALSHSGNQLYSSDKDAYWQVMEPLSPLVRQDMEASAAYWRQYEGPVAEVSTKVNDVYLRSNRQSSGVKSYGQMVDLLLADYRQRHDLA